ncbi:hypothetical protein D3C71_2126740 [compost metagenome]
MGIASGSALGGIMVDNAGLTTLPWTAVGLALLAFAATAISYRLQLKARPRHAVREILS